MRWAWCPGCVINSQLILYRSCDGKEINKWKVFTTDLNGILNHSHTRPSVFPQSAPSINHHTVRSMLPPTWTSCFWTEQLQISHQPVKAAVRFSQQEVTAFKLRSGQRECRTAFVLLQVPNISFVEDSMPWTQVVMDGGCPNVEWFVKVTTLFFLNYDFFPHKFLTLFLNFKKNLKTLM